MENVGDAPSKNDVHAIISFLHLEGVPGNDIHRWLCNVFGEKNKMSILVVYQWIQHFDAGRVTMKDVSGPDRHCDSFNDDTIACIHTLLDKDRRYTITDIHHEMATHFLNNASRSTVYRVSQIYIKRLDT